VSDQADLERAYRRLLTWYPRAFRHENGPEILAVLLACTPDGRRRPGLAATADLVRSGLRMRLLPSVPRSARPVRAAIGLMYAGAAVSALYLLNALYVTSVMLSIDDNKIHHMRLPEITGALQVPHVSPVAVALGLLRQLAVVVLWLWLARATAQRRPWARPAATALLGLATLEIALLFGVPSLLRTGLTDDGLLAMLTWPAGLAAVWLLWCPAATTFFRSPSLPAPDRRIS
jgi:hypothetical protein